MQSPLNKYGDVEVLGDEVIYSIPIAYLEEESLSEIEEKYKHKGHSLKDANHFLFAHDISMVTNRVIFSYYLEHVKSFFYLRQLYFEDQMYYFRSFIELAKHNDEDTRVIWDKYNFFVDLTDGTIKALVFEFEGHKLYNLTPTLDGLKEIILLSLTTLHRVLGKPRIIDFIDQRDTVIRFAEQILRADTVFDVERILEEHITNFEREEAAKREREEYLKGLSFMQRRKELQKEKKADRAKTLATNKLIGSTSATASFSGGQRALRGRGDLMAPTTKRQAVDKEKFTNTKTFYLGSAAVAVMVIAYMGFDNAIDKKEAQAQAVQQQQQEAALSSDQVAEVYRLTMADDAAGALKILETADYSKLAETEQKQMIKLYEKTGQYQKAIELDPKYADTVVNNLVAAKKFDELKNLQKAIPNSDPINYEVAFQEKDYDKLIVIAEGIEMNDRRKKELLLSYLYNDLNMEAKLLVSQENNAQLAKQMKQKMADYTVESKRIKSLNDQIAAAEKNGNKAKVQNLQNTLSKLETKLNAI